MPGNTVPLSSGEITSLWTSYMNNSMSKYMLDFMIKHIQDDEIKPVVQYAYDISCNHIDEQHKIFRKEDYAIPNGFSEQDVNMNAPWLFTDVFCLSYVNHMAKVGMLTYSGLLSMCARDDMRQFYTKALTKSSQLYNNSSEVAMIKGVNYRHPYIETPKETDFVTDKKYLSGLNPLNDKRSLNAVEISHLYLNIVTNTIGINLCLAFAQTSTNEEVQDFMLRSKEVSKKHTKVFVDTLLKDEIEAPHIPDVAVSNSTTRTFSDKLMMFHMSLIMSAGVGNYATAGAASQRSDLMVNYERLSLEVSRIAKSGADIMIKHRWLEQPPAIKNRDKLAKKRNK
ncbi:DUF3231 family protein [Virgibacillus kimchii]